MRRLNKILLLFFAIMFFIFIGVWNFLQSDIFGQNLSKTLNKISQSQADVSISFENLDFQFFPPGANLNNVKVSVDREDIKARAEMAKLGIYFNLIDSFQTKLTIKELFIEDAVVEVKQLPAKGKSKTKFTIDSILETAKEKLPINIKKALLRDVTLKYKEYEQLVNLVSVSLQDDRVRVSADLRNIDLNHFTDFDSSIDQVKLKGSISDKEAQIDTLEVFQGVNMLSTKGSVSSPFEKPVMNLTGKLVGEVSELHKYLDFEKIGKLNQGMLSADFVLKGGISNYNLVTELNLSDFMSDFAYAKSLKAKLKLTPELLSVENATLVDGEQKVELRSPFALFSIKDKKFIGTKLALRANNLKFNNALRYIRKILEPLKGEINGDVDVQFGKSHVRFTSDSDVVVNNLKLQMNSNSKPILQNNTAVLNKPVFSIVRGNFFMNSPVKLDNSEFKVVGKAGKEGIDFVVNQGDIFLEDLGPFAGLDIEGKGKFSLIARGKGKDSVLKIKTSLEDVSFQGFKLSSAQTNLLFDFAKSELVIGSLGGENGKAKLTGELKLNYKTLALSANGKLRSKRYSDIKEILNPLLGKLKFFPSDLYGNWEMDFVAGGRVTLEDIVLKGVFAGTNNYIYDEGFEFLGFKLLLEDKKLGFEDIVVKKSKGFIKGDFNYDLNSSTMAYGFDISQVPLAEISNFSKTPFAFNGVLSGELRGKSSDKINNALMALKLRDTNLAGKRYENSNILVKLGGDHLEYAINLLGQEVVSKGDIYLKKGTKRSRTSLEINSPDIQKPLGLLKFVDQGSLVTSGALELEASAIFDGLEFNNSDVSINLKKLELEKERLSLDYLNSNGPQVVVEGGIIKRWNIEINGSRIFLISKGEGSFDSSYDIDNRFKIDGSILEVFNTLVAQSGGTIRARARFYQNMFKEDYEVEVVGTDLNISSDKLPTEITSADFSLDYKDKWLKLERFSAKLSAGEISAKGGVGLENLVPEVDLSLKFTEAGFPILKKSNLVVSGETRLTGNQLPYSLTGDVRIQKLSIMNEVTDFTKGKQTNFSEEFEYLPEQVEQTKSNFVNMNIDISTMGPVLINNSLADIGLVGNAQLIGGEQNYRVIGKLNLAPRTNKISFKNNEYILTKAGIFFSERSKPSNPELDIAAFSVINDYRVNIKVFGPVDDFNLELSSEPALTQEDVLSLIAFGYTEDLSANLSDQERESMTRAGVGSIIFDSFKINETLKNEFGLQVNLGTEITEEKRSYLSRINSDSSVGKVSSATTIEVKKKLNDAMNLSVTSTVGGGIGQRQSMNLNYNINNKLSFEGVYETKTSDEGEETINDSSLGADVKIRWSFR
ncbi:MAG: translocation/assembly module TamB domain-containing protein [Bacteriovoracaceae bacterium]|nr:translocation/assembly module TamB domain-containing protein [Bacteriovoracaceae bacterium]